MHAHPFARWPKEQVRLRGSTSSEKEGEVQLASLLVKEKEKKPKRPTRTGQAERKGGGGQTSSCRTTVCPPRSSKEFLDHFPERKEGKKEPPTIRHETGGKQPPWNLVLRTRLPGKKRRGGEVAARRAAGPWKKGCKGTALMVITSSKRLAEVAAIDSETKEKRERKREIKKKKTRGGTEKER